MAIPHPEHFFEQAELLVGRSPGSSRQVDLRRAISSAYYGIFHFIVASAANELVGATHQRTARYSLVYRSIDHATIRTTCNDARKLPPPARYSGLLSDAGFGLDMRRFCISAIELQQKRHRADYDPVPRFEAADARAAVDLARKAISAFEASPSEERKLFLTLLICPPRG